MSMHWGLKTAVGTAIAFFLVHAGFTQFYETGYGRILSPLISVAVAAFLVAFLQYRKWSWRIVFWFAVMDVVINLAFLPEREHFGDYLLFAQVLVGLEIAACIAIVSYMLHPATKARFLEHAS
jgi:hypothetical protein